MILLMQAKPVKTIVQHKDTSKAETPYKFMTKLAMICKRKGSKQRTNQAYFWYTQGNGTPFFVLLLLIHAENLVDLLISNGNLRASLIVQHLKHSKGNLANMVEST